MVIYVPGTEEKDPKKVIMSLQQVAKKASPLADAIAVDADGQVGIEQSTPVAPLHVGGNSDTTTNPGILLSRDVQFATGGGHGFVEYSTVDLPAAGSGYAAFDSATTLTGSQDYNHNVSFQSRMTIGSSGTSDRFYDFFSGSNVTAGTVTDYFSHYVKLPAGAGTVTNCYGYYTEELTKGASLNYAYYSAGATPSKFEGVHDVGGLKVGGVDATSAWTVFTPTISANSGAFTSVTGSGRYRQFGKTVFFTMLVDITTNGTAAGFIIATLPTSFRQASSLQYAFPGIISGGVTTVAITLGSGPGNTIGIFKYDGSYPGSSGVGVYVSGSYEAA